MVLDRLRKLFQPEGITLSTESRIGNTRDAHRLIEMARTKGPEAQNAVVDALFRSFWEEGGDITSYDMLVAAGESGGLDGDEVRRWLESGEGGDDVDRQAGDARKNGIQGVPKFVINESLLAKVEGAQDVETFLAEFMRVKEAA